MKYLYPHRDNYAFLASGSVIRSSANSPNFSVKLGLEIFYRCLQHAPKKKDITLYDPCCGVGYLLTIIGVMNAEVIHQVVGSDINGDFLDLARKNVSLLTVDGILKRKYELAALLEQYGKESYKLALDHIDEFSRLIQSDTIKHKMVEQDVFTLSASALSTLDPDIVITDVPYGDLVEWKGAVGLNYMLTSLSSIVSDRTIVAVVHDKYQKLNHFGYRRLEKFKVGKRIVEILSLNSVDEFKV